MRAIPWATKDSGPMHTLSVLWRGLSLEFAGGGRYRIVESRLACAQGVSNGWRLFQAGARAHGVAPAMCGNHRPIIGD